MVFGALAHLESELQGTTAGSLYDQLDIAGSVQLDGTLDLVPLAPYSDPEVRGTSHDLPSLRRKLGPQDPILSSLRRRADRSSFENKPMTRCTSHVSRYYWPVVIAVFLPLVGIP